MSEFHDDFTDLLGAYALDAVEPAERDEIEAHLHTCPWCAAEVAEHREVAALLSHSGTDAPAGVWDRIAAELSPAAPPMRLTLTPRAEGDTLVPPAPPVLGRPEAPTAPSAAAPAGPVAPVTSLAGRRSIRTRTLVAMASAAAVLVAALGFVAVDQAREADRRAAEVATMSTIPTDPDLSVKLTGSRDDMGATAVVTDSGRGYLVSHDLPVAGDDELYQLWGVVDGVVLSLGTFDHDTEVVNFQVDPKDLDEVEAFAVTKERAPGVIASENDAVIAGTVA